MVSRAWFLSLVALLQISFVVAVTDSRDYSSLKSLKDVWNNYPPNWQGTDPCSNNWAGITCSDSFVTSISLANVNLEGVLSGDIASFSELQILDLSNNKGLGGSLPRSIGDLQQLTNLILVGCSFSGPIPHTIGALKQLVYLSLNSNSFSGKIPASIGNLSNLYWLDLAENQLEGEIPVSDGTSPGLDMLHRAKHFHLGQNKLSGEIPEKLFSSEMILIHALLDGNRLTGAVPDSLGLVQTLEIVRLDRNSLSGSVPSNLNNLTSLNELYLSNNKLTGNLPNLTGMESLYTLDLSNNSFALSSFPSSISALQSLSTLRMERIGLEGPVPTTIFSLPQLQTVILKNNRLNGTLDIGTSYSKQLELINLEYNFIDSYKEETTKNNIQVILTDNPVCQESGLTESYCSSTETDSQYSTPFNNCEPACDSDQSSSPNCACSYPFVGTLYFRSPSFSALRNTTYYTSLENNMEAFFRSHRLPVDSVALDTPRNNQNDQKLEVNVKIFPSGQDSFNRTGLSMIGFALTNQSYKPPHIFGPFYFLGKKYEHFTDGTTGSKSSNIGLIIGAVIGGTVLLLLLVFAGIYAYRQQKRAQRATSQNNPFAKWDTTSSNSIGAPQLKGARSFTFDEIKKSTDNFSDTNSVGIGGFGKVYRGVLPTGKLIAIKRAQQGSLQGGLEFKTEIELLSRVHHKNVVSLLGFCFERGEQMLIYEYIPNGSLKDSLTGKSGIMLDWRRRLKIALGAARGLSYLHELADPPIIHRDIKSNNILLDDNLNAKVADFGLSKLLGDPEKSHVTTQVKGTMGYLDPEYYMTQQLSDKSDVYSFGVVLMELLTGRSPIERGKYVVKEIKTKMNKKKSLYDLQEILDPSIIVSTTLLGFEMFVELALRCVEECGANRPAMNVVVKEIENIMQIAGMNPNSDSASSSKTYEDVSKGSKSPYSSMSFDQFAESPVSTVEPK